MEEKRKYKRVPTKSIIMYRVEDYSQIHTSNLIPVETPLTIDISEGGLQFLSIQNLPKGTLLKIIVSPENTTSTVEIIGKVAWAKEKEDSKNFYIGIEFLDVLISVHPSSIFAPTKRSTFVPLDILINYLN